MVIELNRRLKDSNKVSSGRERVTSEGFEDAIILKRNRENLS